MYLMVIYEESNILWVWPFSKVPKPQNL